MASVSVVILTFNEQLHIERAIASVCDLTDQIFVVDSGSTDETTQIATSLGAQVFCNDWVNHAAQFNWALDNLPIKTDWVFRLDADECVSEPLSKELTEKLDAFDEKTNALLVPRRIHFMGRWIAHGGVGERHILRIFRTGQGRCEQRWMDEHILVTEGQTATLNNPLIDDNRQTLTWWTEKHNRYASCEAVEVLLAQQQGTSESDDQTVTGQARKIRSLKNKYYRLPPVFRALMVFPIRYIFLLGFLDGTPGLIFHFLQGCWYRALVDAKIIAVQRAIKNEQLTFDQAIKHHLQIDLSDIAHLKTGDPS